MTNFLLTAESGSMLSSFVIIGITFAMMYFFLVVPQRKKDKQTASMRASLEVGDEILTEGGIVATVVSVREDTIIAETGSDRVKIRFARWAVREIITKV